MAMLLIARHGETDWNRDHRWQGFTGPPLNETGRAQAERLAEQLTGIDAIYSSDTVRVRETAEIAAARLGLPVTTDSRLREVNFGEWEGLTRQEINQKFADGFARWDTFELAEPTGGETDVGMAQRVLAAVRDISKAHAGERVLVVTSGGPIRAVQAHVRLLDQATARRHLERAGNCSLVEFRVDGEMLIDVADERYSARFPNALGG